MEVTKDMFVILEYTVQLKDGSYVKGKNNPVSLNFVVGYDQILPSLEQNLLGLASGTKAEFVIPAMQAFGEHDQGKVERRTLDEFPEGRALEEGKWVVATNKMTQAQYSYYILEKTDESVLLDFNHPLAGKDLFYHVKVVHVRPASREELEYLRPCEFNKEGEDSPASPT